MINKIITLLINIRNTIEYNRKVRDTMKELSQLTNHELNDIGISRGEIYTVAHDSYTKPKRVEVEDVQVNANIRGWV